LSATFSPSPSIGIAPPLNSSAVTSPDCFTGELHLLPFFLSFGS
jgi:hypothetical protein